MYDGPGGRARGLVGALLCCALAGSACATTRALRTPWLIRVTTARTSPFIAVTWAACPGAVSYTLYRRTAASASDTIAATTADTGVIDYHLVAGTMYHYRVLARGSAAVDTALSAPDSACTDPYMIISPRQGDTIHVGETLSVVTSAVEGRNGGIRMSVDGGLRYFTIDKGLGFNGVFVPLSTPVVKVVVPRFFIRTIYDDILKEVRPDTIRPLSTQVLVEIFDYGLPTVTLARSYGVFAIQPSLGALPGRRSMPSVRGMTRPWVALSAGGSDGRVPRRGGVAVATPAGRLASVPGRGERGGAAPGALIPFPAGRRQR